MGDYTDGGGWSKLDGSACAGLARISAGFPRSKAEQWTLVLLTIYRSLDRAGEVTAGYRTIAERAGVPVSVARGVVERLEASGDLVRLGRAPHGRLRMAFSWMCGESKRQAESLTESEKTPRFNSPVSQNNGRFNSQVSQNARRNRSHKNTKKYSEGGVAPAPMVAGTPPDDKRPEWSGDEYWETLHREVPPPPVEASG